MRKKFINEDKSILVYTCDNLKEYFTEFTKYRKAARESDDWEKGLNKFYSEKNDCFREVKVGEIYGKENTIIDFLCKDYNNDFEGRKGRLELELRIDLESSEWLSQRESVRQTLREIWKTGEFKNPYNLDLNWPQSTPQPDQSPIEKKELEQALNTLKYQKSPAEAEKILAAHIGFEKEKAWFKDQVYLYSATQGNFTPVREAICYVGPPGTGKTTFVYRLSKATGRPCQTIACAGQSEFNQFSVLGTKNKPSLVAWAIKKSGCRNPLILLDELEKTSNPQILKDLIKLLILYRQKEKLFDPYFQTEIDLSQITFFATVNYAEKLPLLLANCFLIRKLEKFAPQEKKLILTDKSRQLEKEWGTAEGEIIPLELISKLSYFPEEGVRQSEAILHQVLKEWILWKNDPFNQGKKFSIGDPQKWLTRNGPVVPVTFQFQSKHYPLFILWFILWVLVAVLIAKKLVLKKSVAKHK
ncbi:MAG: lon protease [Mycoplasmataceae bacterium RC_NB112A]|nr:MAG: lon protease [Mycoplasmataceae bacterium RC_NB112A]